MVRPGQESSPVGAEDTVLAAIAGGGRRARFVTEITRDLMKADRSETSKEIERAMAALEQQGKLIVREHYCADPHLEGIDLRIAGTVVPVEVETGDAISNCVQEIEATWQEWITAYLAEHRCS